MSDQQRYCVRDQDRNEWHGWFRTFDAASAWGERNIGCSTLHRNVRRNWIPYSEREAAEVGRYPMHRVCAWCSRVMSDGIADRPGVVTHGICPSCRVTVELQMSDATVTA
jgi:hypothetical protein